jgi:hypothetical protein
LRADDGPDFASIRICFLERDEYLSLIRNFLTNATEKEPNRKPVADIMASIEKLSLGDVLERPVQAKMLAEVVADPTANISAISRFSLYDMFIKRILRREEEKSARRHLGSQERTHFMRLLAWWLWTEKKTRTFAANEIPLEIIQKFQIPNVSLEGLRRELLIGSIIEERNIGHFLSEKTAGIFYFPHTSFTEFLVADYIMSSDFMSIDVAKLPIALYGEVPSFLDEYPTPGTILTIYKRMKAAKIAMTTSCMSVLLNDYDTRMHIELAKETAGDPWDICLRYFLQHAEGAPVRARQFLMACLQTHEQNTELAAMYCLMYEDALAPAGGRSAIAHLLLHIFQRIGILDLISASERGSTTARSSELNHLAEVTSSCIQLSRDTVVFDFAEFTSVALSFISTSCAVSDVMDRVPKTYAIPANDIISLTSDPQERTTLADLLRRQGKLQIIPVSDIAQ